jgi:hypothetical protein
VFCVYRCPCNVIACITEDANLVDSPTVGYQGELVFISRQSMQKG